MTITLRYLTLTLLALLFLALRPGESLAGNEQTTQHKAGDIVIEEAEAKAPGTGESVPVDFGTLYVPENRNDPNGKLIGIVFLRMRSTSRNPGPPIIYLEGGPGVSGINSALGNLFHLFMALREAGDVIVPDQRGSGRSNRLTCSGSTRDFLGVSLKRDAFFSQIEQDSRNCVQSLTAKGVDLSAYNTNENADDIDALRKGLGAPRANLLAYSYGTHLASAVIRRHHENFQRAVMIGTVGPDQLQKLPSGIQKQLVEIRRLVGANAALSRRIPDLLTLMETVLSKLEKHPVVCEIINPKDKRKTSVTVDKFAMQWLTSAFISRRDFIAAIPALYYSMSKDDLSFLSAMLSTVAQRTALPATQTTMRCSSNASRERYKQIQREAKTATLGDAVNFPIPEICSVWGVRDLGDSFRAPVKSRMPILFISGSLDANAPSENVEAMRKHLPNSLHIIVNGGEHEDFFLASSLREQIRDVVTGFMKGNTTANSRLSAPPISFVPVKD